MSFLTDDDFDVQIRQEMLRVIAQSTLSRELAENMAEEEITGYLRPRGYDIPAIFAATGPERNPMIIMRMIDMVVYHLSSNVPKSVISDTRQKRYEAAIDWLEKVNAGKLDPSLPKIQLPDTADSTPGIRLGTNKKYSHRW